MNWRLKEMTNQDQSGTRIYPGEPIRDKDISRGPGTRICPWDESGTRICPEDQSGTRIYPEDQLGTGICPGDESGTRI